MIQKIYNALDLMRNSTCEVPFIAFYRKEEVQPELNIHDLWKVYQWDEKVCHFVVLLSVSLVLVLRLTAHLSPSFPILVAQYISLPISSLIQSRVNQYHCSLIPFTGQLFFIHFLCPLSVSFNVKGNNYKQVNRYIVIVHFL